MQTETGELSAAADTAFGQQHVVHSIMEHLHPRDRLTFVQSCQQINAVTDKHRARIEAVHIQDYHRVVESLRKEINKRNRKIKELKIDSLFDRLDNISFASTVGFLGLACFGLGFALSIAFSMTGDWYPGANIFFGTSTGAFAALNIVSAIAGKITRTEIETTEEFYKKMAA